jgi:hypothetical protein
MAPHHLPAPHPACARDGVPAPARDRRGFALEATLVVLVLLTAVIGAAVLGATVVTRSAAVDVRGARVAYAAEAGADAVMAQLESAIQDGLIDDDELAALETPELEGFAFAVPTVTRQLGAEAKTITSGPFAGLTGLNQRIDIGIEARDALADRSRVVVSVNARSIPIFQFGVFYEDDLEIHPGQSMLFKGRVHTNSNLYLSAYEARFTEIVTASDSVFHQRKSTNDRRRGLTIDNQAGYPVVLDFDSRSTRTPDEFAQRSMQSFDGRLKTGVDSLQLPLPLGVPATELIAPRRSGDSQILRDVKMAWKADWYVEVDLAALHSPTGLCAAILAGTGRRAGRALPSSGTCGSIFTYTPDAFEDGREQIGVDVVDLDVGALMTWIGAAPSTNRTEILFVAFSGADEAASGRDYPALRLKNAQELLYPLTIASDRPLYVQGDYNSVGWKPAALMGDALTLLSADWQDVDHDWDPGAAPPAAYPRTDPMRDLSVNAAVLVGHSATPCDWLRSGCVVPSVPPPNPDPSWGNYGGGAENLARFLEHWSGRTVRYRGSLVSLFESRYAARRRYFWREYFQPPARPWEFDTRFRDPAQLPPGTPAVGNVIRTAFRPVY